MFYKKETDDYMLIAPNFVLNADYELFAETYTENTYPIDGWYWFNDDNIAYTELEVTKPVL
jgi:hypothetical protein